MNKEFSRTTAENILTEKKSFAFDFSLDVSTSISNEESLTSTTKKKNKRKLKKKKKNCEPSLDTSEIVKDSPNPNPNPNPSDENYEASITEKLVSTVEEPNLGPKPQVNIKSSPNPNLNPSLLTSINLSNKVENEGQKDAALTVGKKDKKEVIDEVINEEGKKKKKKKKSAKGPLLKDADAGDDIDFLVKEMNLINSNQTTPITPTTSIKTSIKSRSIAEFKNQKNNDLVYKNTSSNNSSSSSSFAFKSHKDPELSEEQRAKNRFGNGKNLVAIGPPKHKVTDLGASTNLNHTLTLTLIQHKVT
jgi:hypothetical protein